MLPPSLMVFLKSPPINLQPKYSNPRRMGVNNFFNNVWKSAIFVRTGFPNPVLKHSWSRMLLWLSISSPNTECIAWMPNLVMTQLCTLFLHSCTPKHVSDQEFEGMCTANGLQTAHWLLIWSDLPDYNTIVLSAHLTHIQRLPISICKLIYILNTPVKT